MKLFFTIFGAALAAAAVVWGVMSWSKSTDRDKELARAAAVHLAKSAKMLKELVEENSGKLPVGDIWEKSSLDAPAHFAATISGGWPSDGPGRWGVRIDFFSSYGTAVETAKAGGDPRSVAWADEMAKRLAAAAARIDGKTSP
jgi:hypothetical protein